MVGRLLWRAGGKTSICDRADDIAFGAFHVSRDIDDLKQMLSRYSDFNGFHFSVADVFAKGVDHMVGSPSSGSQRRTIQVECQ